MRPRESIIITQPIILFDFDGTVTVGDGPVLAYARQAAAALENNPTNPRGRSAFLETVTNGLTHLALIDPPVLDGYDLVRGIALRHGLDDALLSRAYLASREALGTPQAPVSAPAGLAETLAELRMLGVHLVLGTNAPDIRVTETLTELGLAGLFDQIVTSVGKPAGMAALLDSLGVSPHGDAPVLSVGDVWANDLEPVQSRGHSTALVGSLGVASPSTAKPTYQADTLTQLLPHLTTWARQQRASDNSHHEGIS